MSRDAQVTGVPGLAASARTTPASASAVCWATVAAIGAGAVVPAIGQGRITQEAPSRAASTIASATSAPSVSGDSGEKERLTE